jgi:hypothetical protein
MMTINRIRQWWRVTNQIAKFYEFSIDRVVATWAFNTKEFKRMHVEMVKYHAARNSHWC